MNEPEIKRHRKKSSRHEKSLIREFRIEILIGVLFLIGVFLLFEQMEIKSVVFKGIVSFFQSITQGFSDFLGSLLEATDLFETSDIVGSILILLALLLLLFRVRQKAIVRFYELTECPECGSDLLHVHRNQFQRVFGFIFRLKIRRYQCKNCEYDGVRMRAMKSR
ncbi:MAG: transposase family protein [Candidatus Marinimicrobia bacterium]|nr:transposase family protein [Candidatus Neomarinimicrobiota bacterium]